jgi:hypothetical protein
MQVVAINNQGMTELNLKILQERTPLFVAIASIWST